MASSGSSSFDDDTELFTNCILRSGVEQREATGTEYFVPYIMGFFLTGSHLFAA